MPFLSPNCFRQRLSEHRSRCPPRCDGNPPAVSPFTRTSRSKRACFAKQRQHVVEKRNAGRDPGGPLPVHHQVHELDRHIRLAGNLPDSTDASPGLCAHAFSLSKADGHGPRVGIKVLYLTDRLHVLAHPKQGALVDTPRCWCGGKTDQWSGPENALAAPPVGSTWLGPAMKSPTATGE